MKRVVTIVGARPQFVKVAPVSRRMQASGRLDEVILHTGQHFDDDMSAVFFTELGLPVPTHNLGVHGQSHGAMTGRMLEGVEAFVQRQRADIVLVYGDTNSTLAGALAAAKLRVPVAHVEAGLRSFNRNMPEEINRIVVDHAVDLLFCPTPAAVAQLRQEGFARVVLDGALCQAQVLPQVSVDTDGPWVAWVGDVMYDAVLMFRERARTESTILNRLQLEARDYIVATIHRAENTDDPITLSILAQELVSLSRQLPVVFPVHPRTQQALGQAGMLEALASTRGVRLIEPLSYLDFLRLQETAHAIVTDSGGVQKEAMFLGVPCITLRNETEWPETIASGWNRLAGSRPCRLAAMVVSACPPSAGQCTAFGRGQAAQAIVALLEGVL